MALQQAGVNLVALLSPEHGLSASVADGDPVADSRDPLTGLPVYSLYGATYRPTSAMLAGVDLLLFDIPDIGVRYYTYIWTLSYVLEACAALKLPLWVLDRPNPLSGDFSVVEGPLLDEAQVTSFVGRWSIPVRHSLTIGELALLWNAQRHLNAQVTVVPVENWQRTQLWSAIDLPFIPPSPAMPSAETALIYPGTCLFEGTNLSEGRGTATPFQMIGAPWLDAITVAAAFNAQNLPGVMARVVQFVPQANKFAGMLCRGLMLHVLAPERFRPVAAGLHLLTLIQQLQPDHFRWLPYATADSGAGYGHFDRLIGRLDLRSQLAQLGAQVAAQLAEWTAAPTWFATVQPYLLYS